MQSERAAWRRKAGGGEGEAKRGRSRGVESVCQPGLAWQRPARRTLVIKLSAQEDDVTNAGWQQASKKEGS